MRSLVVPWDILGEWGDAEVVVVDTASRGTSPVEAARRIAGCVTGWSDQVISTYYKRIDTGLRGNVAAELAALYGALGRPFVVAAAAPALGVSTRDGSQRAMAGRTEERRFYGAAPPATSRIATLLPGASTELNLATVRSVALRGALEDAIRSRRHVVCDGESLDDLTRVAHVAATLPLAPVGTYGFGRAYAAALDDRKGRPGVLALVGSRQLASRLQVRHARDGGGLVVTPTGRGADLVSSCSDALRTGLDVVVASVDPDCHAVPSDSPYFAEAIGKAAAAIITECRPCGLVVVGGESASAAFRHCGCDHAHVVCEPWPATPVLILSGGIVERLAMISKSGAVGSPRWLADAMSLLSSGKDRLRPLAVEEP